MDDKYNTLRFKINGGGGGGVYLFVILADPSPAAYFDPPFINFLNFMRDYKEVHKYIVDG